jgi:histidine triad (HIT) family protein
VILFSADGEAAGQEVLHAHLHVIPRYPNDGFEIDAEAWRRPAPTRMNLDDTAKSLTRSMHE